MALSITFDPKKNMVGDFVKITTKSRRRQTKTPGF